MHIIYLTSWYSSFFLNLNVTSFRPLHKQLSCKFRACHWAPLYLNMHIVQLHSVIISHLYLCASHVDTYHLSAILYCPCTMYKHMPRVLKFHVCMHGTHSTEWLVTMLFKSTVYMFSASTSIVRRQSSWLFSRADLNNKWIQYCILRDFITWI